MKKKIKNIKVLKKLVRLLYYKYMGYKLLDFYFIYVNILIMENVKPKGRPKKNDAKRERVIIACSLVDKQKIESAALNAGSSVSGFILNCVKQFIY